MTRRYDPAKLVEVGEPAADAMGLRNEPGWAGAFTRAQAAGALPSGTRIVKCNSEPGDTRADGSGGTILGSISHPSLRGGEPLYFIAWDATPRMAVGVMAFKIKPAAP